MRRRSVDDADALRVCFELLQECRRRELPALAPLVLAYIGMQPDCAAGLIDIRKELGLSKPQMTRLTTPLVEAGLIVTAMAVEDRRQTVLRLSSRGRSVVGK